MENEDIYQEARKKVKAKKGFLYHFAAYAAVLAILYVIMLFEGNGAMLPVILVGLSWGIGIAIHYLKTFGTVHLDFLGISPNWEEEELEQEIERLKKKRELQERLREERALGNDLDSLELKELENTVTRVVSSKKPISPKGPNELEIARSLVRLSVKLMKPPRTAISKCKTRMF